MRRTIWSENFSPLAIGFSIGIGRNAKSGEWRADTQFGLGNTRVERWNSRIKNKLQVNVKVIRVNWFYIRRCIFGLMNFRVGWHWNRRPCASHRSFNLPHPDEARGGDIANYNTRTLAFECIRCNKSYRTRESRGPAGILSGNRLIYVIRKYRKHILSSELSNLSMGA